MSCPICNGHAADMKSSAREGYDCFEQLIVSLRAEGHADVAARLDCLLHKVAWTTGSELLGELGLEILGFQNSQPTVTKELRQLLGSCLEIVRRVWPDIK